MTASDEAALIARRRKWIADSLGRRSKALYAFKAFFMRVLPGISGVGSGRGLFTVLARLFLTFLIASTPFWYPYFGDPEAFDLRFALQASALLAGLMFVAWLIDVVWLKRASDAKALKLRQQVAALEANLHSDMANLVNPHQHVQGGKEDEFLTRILATMADAARVHLRNFDDTEFQATLFLFSDDNLSHFLYRARARADRPTGHTVRCTKTIAYFWLERFPDRASSVHDITKQKVFEPRLSDGARGAEYRSILFLPLAKRDAAGDSHLVRGMITLDSRRRYEFWGARRVELESLLEPYIRWILAITDDHPHLRKVERRA